jgi:hypothetical protein
MFARLRIPAELVAEADIRRVDHGEACVILSTHRWPDVAGILFPYVDPKTGRAVTSRVRRDHPEIDCDGKPKNKYLSPYGDRRHLYFPPGSGELLCDVSVPVVIVEAEKSALAVMAMSRRVGRPFLAIACGGCWGWMGKIGIVDGPHGERCDQSGPLPDLSLVEWKEREVFIALDANANSNKQVRHARLALALEGHGRGGRARLVELPELPEVNGPDDLLGLAGDDEFLALLSAAKPLPESALAEAKNAVQELENNPSLADEPGASTRLLSVVSAVQDPGHRNVLEKKMAKVLHWPVPAVRSGVQARAAERQAASAHAQEVARKAQLRSMHLDLPMLAATLETFFAERAYLPEGAALVLAMFTLNTWVFDVFDATPYVLLDSATPGCGKNTVMNLLEAVCACPQMLTSASEAALFRTIDQHHPTVLLDEAELLAGRGERADYLRSVVQAGYKKGGKVPRVIGPDHELQYFDVYCPKVFAAIGGFRDALLDRTIVIHMEKAPAGHVRKSTRQKHLQRDSAQLREWTEAYAEQSREQLAQLYANEPDEGYWQELRDREAELWGPLLLHARLIGPEWETRLLVVAVRYSGDKVEIQRQEYNIALTTELLKAVEEVGFERFAPAQLVSHLDGEAWGEKLSRCADDKAKSAKVGKFLSRFRLSSRDHTRAGTTYSRQEAMEKLSAHIPAGTVTTVTYHAGPQEQPQNTCAGDSVTDVIDEDTDSAEVEALLEFPGPDVEEQVVEAKTEVDS